MSGRCFTMLRGRAMQRRLERCCLRKVYCPSSTTRMQMGPSTSQRICPIPRKNYVCQQQIISSDTFAAHFPDGLEGDLRCLLCILSLTDSKSISGRFLTKYQIGYQAKESAILSFPTNNLNLCSKSAPTPTNNNCIFPMREIQQLFNSISSFCWSMGNNTTRNPKTFLVPRAQTKKFLVQMA